ncbi:MAG: hypothetical protein KJ964_00570 [Verrucomicrobia bacterium]|nr:hypothetical protein [Verrucomicrobiota bacterium]MBU1736167.1 hypothetical protein [Verrucomicrobiota bacterium]MBU1856767.1 hypothetical protein [Verrucomicrobiota bacterium]
MKQQHLVLVVIAAIALNPICGLARLDETEAQCEQRYGKPQNSLSDKSFPILSGAVNRIYQYQGWCIRIAFIDGKAVIISYSKSAKAAGGITIRNDEVKAILDAEGNGGEWKGSRNFNLFKPGHPKKWSNTNGSIAYLVGITRAVLVVESPKVEELNKAQAQTTEEPRKESIPKF